MTAIEEPAMGRFSVEVELTNHEDLFAPRPVLSRQSRCAESGFAVSSTAVLRGW